MTCHDARAVLIRSLGPDDALASWELRLRGFEESPGAFKTEAAEWRAKPYVEHERMLRGETGSPEDFLLGAFSPSLCGQVGLRRETRRKCAHRARLWGMYVAPEARGNGVAIELVAELLLRARRIPGLAIIELTVMADNASALALYRRAGFERFGYQPRAVKVDDTYFDEEHLMLDIDRR
jgi:RimJ/RimL family protein N-acetyltransferase